MLETSRRESPVVPPTYGYTRDGKVPYKPTVKEIWMELGDSLNFFHHPSRALPLLSICFHFMGLVCLLSFFIWCFSWKAFLYFFFSVLFMLIIYNTVWYHRYCSHGSFEFAHPKISLLFLMTNPFIFREESYALPHRVHHQYSDDIGDPYGPHLGRLGAYFAHESAQKLDMNMSGVQYEAVKKSIQHIGLRLNTYEEFKRSGAVEKPIFFLARTSFSQLCWLTISYLFGGVSFILAWYGATFVSSFIIRDFNWWGHGGNFRTLKKSGWEFDQRSRALNQRFYGYCAGEWHDNHHKYPMSANAAFLPTQLDFAFMVIRLLRKLGLVASYCDAKEKFSRECLRVPNI